MALKLVETLRESVEELKRLEIEGILREAHEEPPCEAADGVGWEPKPEPARCEVVDFQLERAAKGQLTATEVDPETLLRLALQDVQAQANGKVTKCYITLIIDEADTNYTTCNYRSNLTRTEEIAFRQLGLTEAVEGWRNG